ncbi:MAG: YggS family pyridoxal phosphate-dependent enzyme [Actinomycetota bacterium]
MSETRSPETIAANLARIRDQIARACARSGRDPHEVRIVAAAKTFGPVAIARVRDAGVREVGENYVNELRACRAEVKGVSWHFIGTLQSHSAHHVAELADVVETVTPSRAMQRLARRAAGLGRTIPVLVEVDFTGTRTGVAPEAVDDAVDDVVRTDGVDLAGLMTVPPIPAVAEDSRPFFRRLREIRDGVVTRYPEAKELSMGMSLDYAVAVEEGATMVRIGTALFGARRPEDAGRT